MCVCRPQFRSFLSGDNDDDTVVGCFLIRISLDESLNIARSLCEDDEDEEERRSFFVLINFHLHRARMLHAVVVWRGCLHQHRPCPSGLRIFLHFDVKYRVLRHAVQVCCWCCCCFVMDVEFNTGRGNKVEIPGMCGLQRTKNQGLQRLQYQLDRSDR